MTFDKVVKKTEGIYNYLSQRGWDTPDDPFWSAQKQIIRIQKQAIDNEVRRLERYREEA